MLKNLILLLTFTICGFCLINGQNKGDSIQTKDIQTIIIKALHKKQFSDHARYTFDKDVLEKARHSKDLLTSLPELQLDPLSNTVKSIKGGKVLFLINGIEASDNQIKSIAPTNVVRVEYFDISPARYSQRADTVVNIITRNPEVGYSYGADATSALTTGFVNGSAYAGYTKGKNDFGLEYSINLRDYNNRQYNKVYDYDLNGTHYRSDFQGKDHFGYTDQNIAVRYANVNSGKYSFQAKFTINPNIYFSKGNANSIFQQGNLSQNDVSVSNSNSSYTNPSLDLYYSMSFGEKNELIFNLISSYYITRSSQLDHEWNTENNVDVFNNDMNLKAKQTGIVGEIAHTYQFEKGKLSSGYRLSNTAISNDLVNLLGSSYYDVNYLTQYLYTEYIGKWNKLGYRLGIGITNIHNKSAETTQSDWAPSPKLLLSYPLAKNQNLRFFSTYTSSSPQSSQLSPNIVQIVPNIVSTGNPYLKAQRNFRNELIYSLNNKYFDFNASLFYKNYVRGINKFYHYNEAQSYYESTYENLKSDQLYGIQLSGSVKPFSSEILVLRIYLKPMTELMTDVKGKKVRYSSFENSFSLASNYKNFSFQYQFSIPVFILDSSTSLSTTENANHLFANYQYNNWKFTMGFYWLGMPSEYQTKPTPNSLVNLNAHTQIFNNKNMFVLGLSYDFSSGKKLQIQKKLNNYTAPAATF